MFCPAEAVEGAVILTTRADAPMAARATQRVETSPTMVIICRVIECESGVKCLITVEVQCGRESIVQLDVMMK